MTHHARLNLIMAVTITGLMLFLYFRPQLQSNPEFAISSNPAEAVQSVRIVRQQQEMTLKRRNDHWYLLEPLQAWADEEKVAKILEILKARSQQRLPSADLGRFGLERPHVQLYAGDAYFGFGGFAPTTDQQYVAAGDHVYLISPRYALALPRNASDLINPGLLAPGETPVKFELPHGEVEFRAENWRATWQQAEGILTEETIKQWVQLWQTARATELIMAAELGSGFAEAGLLKIGLQDGRQIDLKILQNEFAIVLLRVNEGIGYRFPVIAGQQLLDPNILKLNK